MFSNCGRTLRPFAFATRTSRMRIVPRIVPSPRSRLDRFEGATSLVRSLRSLRPDDPSRKNGLGDRYERLVEAVDPYAKLMRIDKPTGSWLLFWPCGWSILLASDPHAVPLESVVENLGLFLAGAFVMRGAGCTINDMWDRDIDAKVSRTKSRPLVDGRLTMKRATLFLGAQLSVGLGILLQLNWYSVVLGASSMLLVVCYPLAKRVTDYPQLALGLAFNWGALLGWSALRGQVDPAVCLPLYGAGVCWTLLYDTIYAHQDKRDDAIIGIGSTALKFDAHTKPWLALNATGALAGLAAAGAAVDLRWPYYAVLAAVGLHVGKQIYTLNKDCPEDCAAKFVSNARVGLYVFLGILLGKWDDLKQYLANSAPVQSQKLYACER